nr:unnamed protein product [Digitaria exilis]
MTGSERRNGQPDCTSHDERLPLSNGNCFVVVVVSLSRPPVDPALLTANQPRSHHRSGVSSKKAHGVLRILGDRTRAAEPSAPLRSSQPSDCLPSPSHPIMASPAPTAPPCPARAPISQALITRQPTAGARGTAAYDRCPCATVRRRPPCWVWPGSPPRPCVSPSRSGASATIANLFAFPGAPVLSFQLFRVLSRLQEWDRGQNLGLNDRGQNLAARALLAPAPDAMPMPCYRANAKQSSSQKQSSGKESLARVKKDAAAKTKAMNAGSSGSGEQKDIRSVLFEKRQHGIGLAVAGDGGGHAHTHTHMGAPRHGRTWRRTVPDQRHTWRLRLLLPCLNLHHHQLMAGEQHPDPFHRIRMMRT